MDACKERSDQEQRRRADPVGRAETCQKNASSLPHHVEKESEKEINLQSCGPMLEKRGGSRSSQVTAEAQTRSPPMEMC